jgi:hypothetical protein
MFVDGRTSFAVLALAALGGGAPAAPGSDPLWQGTVIAVHQVVSPISHAWKIVRVDARLRERGVEPIRARDRDQVVGRQVTLWHEGGEYEERFLYRGEGGPGEGRGTIKLAGEKSGSIRFKTVAQDLKPLIGEDLPREGRYDAGFVPGRASGMACAKPQPPRPRRRELPGPVR